MNNRAVFVKGMVDDNYPYAIEKYDEKPLVFPEVFDEEKSDRAYEQYTTVVSTGSLPKVPEGGSLPDHPTTEGYTAYVTPNKYGEKMSMTNESIDDNRHIKNFLKKWMEGWGESSRRTQEDEHANLFNYGGFTAGTDQKQIDAFLNDISNGVLTTPYGPFVYDTAPFFNVSTSTRASKSGGAYYNGIATMPLNTANLEMMFNLMTVTNSYDEAGKKVQIIPDTIITAYGSANYFTARRIIESPASVDAAQAGVANLWQSQLKVIGWSSIAYPNMWIIGCSKKGLKSTARTALSFKSWEDKDNEVQVVSCSFRFGRGVTNWRYWAAANITQS